MDLCREKQKNGQASLRASDRWAGWHHPHLTGVTSYKSSGKQTDRNPADEAVAIARMCLKVEPA